MASTVKPIPGLPEYSASENGEIYGPKFGFKKPIGRKDNKGYVIVSLAGKNFKAHRIVAQTFIPNPDGKPEINHKNGVKDDNHVSNLEWVTRSENQKHAYQTGLCYPIYGDKHWTNRNPEKVLRGSRHGGSKLTEEQVIEMRKEWTATDKKYGLLKKLGRKYNIHYNKVYEIVHRKTWRHV